MAIHNFYIFSRHGNMQFLHLLSYTVKPVLSDHIKQGIFLAFKTGGRLLLHESSAEA